MKGVRIQYSNGFWLVDVTCTCGANGLTDAATGESSFKHRLPMLADSKMILMCSCRRLYLARAQTNHVHVDELRELAPEVIDSASSVPQALAGDGTVAPRLLNPAS